MRQSILAALLLASLTGLPAGPSFDARQLQPPASGMNRNDYAGNFADFLAARPKGRPFYFWYGASEPHRRCAKGSGLQAIGSIGAVSAVFRNGRLT